MMFTLFVISSHNIKASIDDQTFFKVIDAQMRVLANNSDPGITLEDALNPTEMTSFFHRIEKIADQIMVASAGVIADSKSQKPKDFKSPFEQFEEISPDPTFQKDEIPKTQRSENNNFDEQDFLLEEAFAELDNQSFPVLQECLQQEKQQRKVPLTQEQEDAVSDYLHSAKHPMGDSNTEEQLDLLKNHNARGRAAYRLETAARSRSDSPITRLYKELTIKIGINEEQRKEVLKKGNITDAKFLGREFQELLDEKMTLESQMYKRQAYRECADGDIRGYLRAGEIITSFMPNLAGAVANAGFSIIFLFKLFSNHIISTSRFE